MYCRKCGNELPDDSAFCPKCGTQVADAKEAEAPQDTPPKKPAIRITPEEEKEPLLFPPKETDSQVKDAEKPASAPVKKKPEPDPAPERKPEPESKETAESKPAEPEDSTTAATSALPASLLPKPDQFPEEKTDPVEEKKRAKRQKKVRKRRHPKDAYDKLRERMNFTGCFFLILIAVLLPVLILAYFSYREYNRFVNEEKFTSVYQSESVVDEAPGEDTLYWGFNVLYEAPETDREIAIVGGSWWLSGTFREKVYFRGYQLVLEPGARFEKGIDVNAIRLDAGNAVIDGDFTGSVMFQKDAEIADEEEETEVE